MLTIQLLKFLLTAPYSTLFTSCGLMIPYHQVSQPGQLYQLKQLLGN